MGAMGLRWIAAAALTALCAPAQPVVETISPRGARRGTAVRLTLTGERLGTQARLLSGIPGGAVPLSTASAAAGGPAESISWLVEVAADAPLGAYPLRVETPEGISNVSLFAVGEFPQVEEAESAADQDERTPANDFPESAQAVETPVTIDGRLRGPERDLFRFRAAKGEKLVLEVEAQRLGSAIDPRLELLDPQGRVLARSADARGLGVDARLDFEFPADGQYFALVHDERFSKQKADFYRLTIADYVYADGVFPLGWRRGERVYAEFFGGNLKAAAAAQIDLTGVEAPETWVRPPHSPARLHFLAGGGPEIFEDDAVDSVLPEGTVVNGRILQAGEIDRYRLPVEPGEHWSLELRSGELPGSELYGVLTVSRGGEALAVAGRYAGDPRPSVISTTGQTASYPFINLEVPPATAQLTVTVEDLLQRGGPAHGYRLTARRQGPDFLASLDVPFVNVPARGSAPVSVTVERRGYQGAIDLFVENPPDDIVVGGGHIPPVSRLGSTRPRFAKGTLTLSAKPGAQLGAMNLVVRARGVRRDGSTIERRARGPGMRVEAADKARDPLTAPWLGCDLPARLVPEQPAAVEFLTPRALRVVRGGKRHAVRWAVNLRGGASLAKPFELPRSAGALRLRVNDDKSKARQGEFLIFPHERTALGKTDFNMKAEVRAGGRTHTVYSAPLEIELVDGYGLRTADALEIPAGGAAAWSGSIRRDPEFRRTVKVYAENLPVGVACEAAELSAAAAGYRLQCTASADAAAGEYEVEIHAQSTLSDEATTPYAVDPLKTKLTVVRN